MGTSVGFEQTWPPLKNTLCPLLISEADIVYQEYHSAQSLMSLIVLRYWMLNGFRTPSLHLLSQIKARLEFCLHFGHLEGFVRAHLDNGRSNVWTNLEDLPRTSRSVISVTFSLRKNMFHVCLSKNSRSKINSWASIISVLTSTIAT